MPINYTYTQPYNNWMTPSWMHDVRALEVRSRTFELVAALDDLEPEVYKDRDCDMANSMLDAIGVNIATL